jgi:hypothetical protein
MPNSLEQILTDFINSTSLDHIKVDKVLARLILDEITYWKEYALALEADRGSNN